MAWKIALPRRWRRPDLEGEGEETGTETERRRRRRRRGDGDGGTENERITWLFRFGGWCPIYYLLLGLFGASIYIWSVEPGSGVGKSRVWADVSRRVGVGVGVARPSVLSPLHHHHRGVRCT